MKELIEKLAELKAKQQQNASDIEAVQANKDRLIAEMEALEAQIEAEKKPKLKNGQRFMSHSTGTCYVYDALSDRAGVIGATAGQINAQSHFGEAGFTLLSDIFDDLKALQEDVTEFSLRNNDRDNDRSLDVALTDDGHVKISIDPDGATGRNFTVSSRDLSEAILKLRQMEATLKRKQAK